MTIQADPAGSHSIYFKRSVISDRIGCLRGSPLSLHKMCQQLMIERDRLSFHPDMFFMVFSYFLRISSISQYANGALILGSAAANGSTKANSSRDSSFSPWLCSILLSLSICAVYHIDHLLRVVFDDGLPDERRVTPVAELTLPSSGWLMRASLLVIEKDGKVDDEHEEEGKEGD